MLRGSTLTIPRRADDRDLRRWKPRTRPKGLAVHRQPQGEICRALAFRWIRGTVIAVAVDVQDVHLIEASRLHQCLGGSNDDAAIASDQQRHVAWLVQNRHQPITQDLPSDARSRPITDRRNFMMG